MTRNLTYLFYFVLIFSLILIIHASFNQPSFILKNNALNQEVITDNIVFSNIEYLPNQTRNKHQQPFAVNSIWNLPLRLDAQYKPTNLGQAYDVSPEVNFYIVTDKNDPMVNWYDIKNWGVGRCEKGGKLLGKIPIPDDLIVPDATPTQTPNNAAAFLQPDGKTLISMNPLTRCEVGGPVFGHSTPQKEDIYGLGITGGQGGSGLSSIGGTIRLGELLPNAPPIAHALKFLIYAHQYLYSQPPSYRWPAIRADDYAFDDHSDLRYQGTNPNLVMGALLAIPPNVKIEDLELKTIPAKKLFYALQDFGGYIVDDTAWDSYAIAVEKGVPEEFKQTYGFSFWGNRQENSDFYQDLNKLFQSLAVVINNQPQTDLNPVNFRQPLAPPIGN